MAPNKNPNATVYRFITRMILGLIACVIAGSWLDQRLGTTPWLMLISAGYVILGSLVLLLKEVR